MRRLKETGFAEFELMVYPGHLWPSDDLRPLKAALGGDARIVTLNMPNIDVNIAAASPDMRTYSLGFLEQVIDLANTLGVAGVVVGPGKANPLFPAGKEELTGHFFRALDRLAPRAQAGGTALWLENMPFAFLPGIDALMSALDRYGDPALGLVYDVANAHFIGEDLGRGLTCAQPRLKRVHLSDTGTAQYRHDPVGHGTVPFETVPALLAGIGHRERPMLEIISTNADGDIADSVQRLAAFGF